MPATPDYTLIQFMRGEKYAVETAIPESGEPLLDLDSGTLYYGNGKDRRGIPVNTGACIQLESPVDLNDLVTWGKYFIEGKATNLPDGLELYNKFFLIVEGSTATDAISIFQTIHVLVGDCQDQIFVRSSVDSGQTWTSWKGISGSSVVSFDPNGGGTADKDPSASLDKYIFPSYSYIQSISGGPEDSNGKSGFLIVYRKDQESPYIYQQLIVADPDSTAGKVYCRLSANGNQDWSTPGYNWREISYVPATTSQVGVVRLSSATDSESETIAATAKAVKIAYDTAVAAGGAASQHASTSVYGTTKLSSATNSVSEELAATPKAVKTSYDKANDAYNKADAAYNLAETASSSIIPASTSQAGIVQLSNNYTATGEDKAPTLTALKAVYDIAIAASGGTELPEASTTVYGITKLSSATNSNSESLAATPKAVKVAYDLASSAVTAVDAKKWIQYSSSDTSTAPSDLPDGGFLVITS